MTRSEIQQKAVRMMRETSLLVLQWATGLGKSKAAIDIVQDLFEGSLPDNPSFEDYMHSGFRVLLVVAETAHKNNWKEEFEKFDQFTLWERFITVDTYASLKNHRGRSYDLIILDEAHHAGSDLRTEILGEIKADKVLALSATMPFDAILKLGTLYDRKASSFKVSLQQAVDWKILPEPKLYLIPMELDNTIGNQTIIEEWGNKADKKRKAELIKCSFHDRWTYMKNKVKYPCVRLEIQSTELQKYSHLSNKIEFWKKQFMRTRNEGVKNKWLQFGSERKRYLGSLKDKKALEVLNLIKDKRYICFCSSIEQAERLGEENSIHSQKKGSLNTIEDFNSKRIDSLFAIGMIQEGQNLVDIEAGVIIQLDGQERAFIQKSGRAMRAEEPVLFILYYKNTRDEEYLKKALEGINPDYVVEVEDLNEIKL